VETNGLLIEMEQGRREWSFALRQ